MNTRLRELEKSRPTNLRLFDFLDQLIIVDALHKGAVAGALTGLAAIVQHPVNEEWVRTARACDADIGLLNAWSVQFQNAVDLFPALGIDNKVIEGGDLFAGSAIEDLDLEIVGASILPRPTVNKPQIDNP